MGTPINNAKEYYELFKDNEITSSDDLAKDCCDLSKKPSKKSSEALKYALDIRKFEIELYWKRASYFWVLIAAALVAYVAVAAKDVNHKTELSVIISALGLIFSCGWLAVNKGSKFWQENWEKHVDMLEDRHMGPLYKTVFNNDKGFLSLGGSTYSVSKINLMISFYVVFLWFGLLSASVVSIWLPDLLKDYSKFVISAGVVITFIFCWFLLFKVCKTKINFKGEECEKIKAVLRGKPLQ